MRYIALGDSISIDDYPQHETGRSGLGAASLFYRNDDEYWPEFRRRDLSTLRPGTTFLNLTADGATTDDVLRAPLPHVNEEAIVTVTAGGNDMLMHLRAPHPPAQLVEGMIERIERILQRLEAHRVFLGTVYDPSDGTNMLYGERLDREAQWLAQFNDAIRRIAVSRKNVRLIDIHRHFLGHGITAPVRERWYWSELIFEPNARGASEVRRLWLDAL
ncbi:MAG TPA: SGNH/GDSL hydrolase family protein [Thermoanaerobaculia bacterium]